MRLDHLLSKELPVWGAGLRRVVVGFLLVISTPLVRVGGCGWVEHFCCLVRTCSGLRGRWLGTLLGPEETPVWVLFSGPPPGRASNAFRFVVGVVVSGVWGVVVC